MSKFVPVTKNGSLHEVNKNLVASQRRFRNNPHESGSHKSFATVLGDQQREVRLSVHAQKRLEQQNITISPQDFSRISDAAQKAEKKGARESLMLLRDLALVVNINNRTVITAVDKARQKEKIFTNIDSTVIL